MPIFAVNGGDCVNLGNDVHGFAGVHVFETLDILAIEAALGAQRPLLLLGEPGVGKSQLARAAAVKLGWNFCSLAVDAQTEARDLKWTEDLVARLAKAQILGALKAGTDLSVPDETKFDKVLETVDLKNFIRPGPLWWAFDWVSAFDQATRAGAPVFVSNNPANRTVVLIDEIDKAQSDLPNGLLEALGQREFKLTGPGESVRAQQDNWPLVIITSNEERRMPDAFVRRCAVHKMKMPEAPEALQQFLIARGAAHFPRIDKGILETAAKMTVADREKCKELRLFPLPGQAEYLDLLGAVASDPSPSPTSAEERLTSLGPFFLRKHPDAWQ